MPEAGFSGFSLAVRRTWLEVRRWIDSWWGYDVFIAHRRADAADYAQSLYEKLTAEKISGFIDRVIYGPGDSLLIATRRHVTKSALFLLVGSPELLEPRHPVDWIEREIQTYLEAQQTDPKVILVDFGDVIADALSHDETADAASHPILKLLSPFLRISEPAEALGQPPSEAVLGAIRRKLDGRRRDRTRLIFFEVATSVLALLLILAIVLGVATELAREEARAQAFANAAYSYSDRDPTLALRLAQNAMEIEPNTTARLAVLRAFNLGSWFYGERLDGARDAVLSSDAAKLAWIDDGSSIHVRELRTGTEKTWRSDSNKLAFSSAGGVVAWKGWSGQPTHGSLGIWDADGRLRKLVGYDFVDAVDCGGDTIIIPAFASSVAPVDASRTGMQLQAIDSISGAERTLALPTQGARSQLGWNGSLRVACTMGGEVVAVVQQLLSAGAVVRKDGQAFTFDVSAGYMAQDTDISVDAKHVAIFLRGSVKGMKDAVGILELTATNGNSLAIVPLEETPAADSGGVVRFLDNDRVIVASTAGWNRIVDVNTRAIVVLPSKQRGADAIAVNRTAGEFAIARRSGSVAIYDKASLPIARLVGNPPSDGLNPAFRRIDFGSKGDVILTVARDGARLWRRPKDPLITADTPGHELEAASPTSFRQAFGIDGNTSATTEAASCRDRSGFNVDILIDDAGSMALCINLDGRNELLPTGLTREEFSPRVSTEVDKARGVVVWDDGDYLRLFALDPERVMAYAEHAEGIWSPDPSQLSRLIK